MNFTRLDQWLSYLEQLHPTAIDMGLERSREVLQRMAIGRPAPRVYTVTGTNGKGSTCALLAGLLASQGLRVGVYSSPHLLRYNERVQIDGQPASDEQLCDAFAAVEQARGEVSLTYFEMGTLAAFWLFHACKLDAVVLEVGLGGRLDAVNLVDADLALVTSIGVDHIEWLGDSRESVAFEKAGIFRPGIPALCGDPQPPQTLVEQAERLGAPLLVRGRQFDLDEQPADWSWQGVDAEGKPLLLEHLPLLSLPQVNAALALQAYALTGLPWDGERIGQTLTRIHMAGRLQRVTLDWQGQPRQLLLDVGHNPHASQYLASRLQPLAGKRHAVFGLLSDKDLAGVIEPLLGKVDHWQVASLPTARSRSAAELQQALLQHGALVDCSADIVSAIESQCQRSGPQDEILVFGSFYVVAEALAWLERRG